MFKSILSAAIAIIVGVILVKIIFGLMAIAFKLATFLIMGVLIAVIALPIFVIVKKKLLK
jgi:hypothetical protein